MDITQQLSQKLLKHSIQMKNNLHYSIAIRCLLLGEIGRSIPWAIAVVN